MFFGKKERQTEELIQRHFEVVGRVVILLRGAVDGYCKTCDEFDDLAKRVLAGESEADSVRRGIEGILYDGAFMPVQRGDYARMVEDVDKVANQCESVAQFLMMTRPEMDPDTKEGLCEIMDATVRCYSHIPEMFVRFDEGRKVIELSHKIEEEEQNVDDIFARVVTELFESDMDLAQKLHLKMLLDRAASISNRIEDASDRFCIIITSSP